MLFYNHPHSSVLASSAKADLIWGRLQYLQFSRKQSQGEAICAGGTNPKGRVGSCPNDSPVALPNELLQCFQCSWRSEGDGTRGAPGAECVHEACRDPPQLRWMQGDDPASTNKAWLLLLFPTMNTSPSSIYSFHFSSKKAVSVTGPSLPNRMPVRQGKDRRCYSPWTLNPLNLSLGKSVGFLNQIVLITIDSIYIPLTNIGVLSKVWVSIKKPWSWASHKHDSQLNLGTSQKAFMADQVMCCDWNLFIGISGRSVLPLHAFTKSSEDWAAPDGSDCALLCPTGGAAQALSHSWHLHKNKCNFSCALMWSTLTARFNHYLLPTPYSLQKACVPKGRRMYGGKSHFSFKSKSRENLNF